MQFYRDGYKTGDPFTEDAHPSVAQRSEDLPEEVDVLIIGCVRPGSSWPRSSALVEFFAGFLLDSGSYTASAARRSPR
jgi:hypothetical protein